jgi:serine protease Do
MDARVARQDAWRDVALLETGASDLMPAPLGDDRSLRAGSVVIALGHPLGWAGALALGIVHRVARDGPRGSVRWIQADVRLAPGNSGGPLADADGRVVGINAMVANGLGLAVPVSALRRFLLPDADRPRLGVRMRPIEVRVNGRRGVGLLVVDTSIRGAAERAGVRAGDVLIGADGVRFAAPFDLTDALALASSGMLRIEMVRNGSVREVDAHLDRPDPGARAA